MNAKSGIPHIVGVMQYAGIAIAMNIFGLGLKGYMEAAGGACIGGLVGWVIHYAFSVVKKKNEKPPVAVPFDAYRDSAASLAAKLSDKEAECERLKARRRFNFPFVTIGVMIFVLLGCTIAILTRLATTDEIIKADKAITNGIGAFQGRIVSNESHAAGSGIVFQAGTWSTNCRVLGAECETTPSTTCKLITNCTDGGISEDASK